MKHRIALLAVLALLVAVVPASGSSETEPGDDNSSLSPAVRPTEAAPAAQRPARTASSDAPASDEEQPASVTETQPDQTGIAPQSPQPAPDANEPAEFAASRRGPDEQDPPPRVGRPSHGGGGGGHGGPGGGGWQPPNHPPHGRRGQWRRDHYHHHGSWSFLIFGGPVIWCPPPHHSSHIVRLPRRSGIYVRQTGDDEIGRAFATSVRERLREQGLQVVHSEADAAIELYIVSMDEDPEDPGWGSAVSVSYISYPGERFITAQMLDVGDEQVDELAEYVAEYVDELARDYCR